MKPIALALAGILAASQAVAVHAQAVGPGVVVLVVNVQVVVLLLVGQAAIRQDLVTVHPVRPVVGNVEQRLVG